MAAAVPHFQNFTSTQSRPRGGFLIGDNMIKQKGRSTAFTQEEVIAALHACAEKLGRAPRYHELTKMSRITIRHIMRHFGTFNQALRAAGMEVGHAAVSTSMGDLFQDWAEVARKAKRVPSINDQSMHGKYSVRPFLSRFGGWKSVAEGMRAFAESSGRDKKYPELMKMIAEWSPRGPGMRKAVERGLDGGLLGHKPRLLPDRPVYGRPLTPPGLAHEPVNEMGVLYLFGMVAYKLGLVVTHIQAAFPDCEALREVERGRWQRLRIELEFESRNFLLHKHDPKKCDVIVCWKHNWAECPANIEVIELSSVMKRLM
jgi:hypothetical protein